MSILMKKVSAVMLFSFLPMTAHAASGDLWGQMVGYIYTQQQMFHQDLASALRLVQEMGPSAAWGLISVSFL